MCESSVASTLFVKETAFSPISTFGILLKIQVPELYEFVSGSGVLVLLIYISLCHCPADFTTILLPLLFITGI